MLKTFWKNIGNKNIIKNIIRIQASVSIICGRFCMYLYSFYFMQKSDRFCKLIFAKQFWKQCQINSDFFFRKKNDNKLEWAEFVCYQLLQLNNPPEFRFNRIKQIEDFFITKTNDRRNISYTLNNFITTLDFASKTLLVFLFAVLAGSAVSLFSFSTVISALVGIASVSISLIFLASNEIVQIFLKIKGRKKWAQKNYFIGHYKSLEPALVSNKRQNYLSLEKGIRTEQNQQCDFEHHIGGDK